MRGLGPSPQFAALASIAALVPSPLAAQQPGGADAASAAEGDAIVVNATRPRGGVLGDIPPDHSLDAAAIAGYAAADLSELIAELAPLVQGVGDGEDSAPVILLNGKRVSSFREIRAFPPEALERVDIFPEEVALKYGFKPDQKVVNFVLLRNVRSINTELQSRLATAGGAGVHEADGAVLNVGPRGRSSIDIEFRSENPIFESERRVARSNQSLFDPIGNVGAVRAGGEIDPHLSALLGRPVVRAGVPQSARDGRPALEDFAATADAPSSSDLGRYRTLEPARRDFTINGSLNRTLWGDVDATVNGRFEVGERVAHLGLAGATLAVPASNPYSPFSRDVRLSRYDLLYGPRLRDTDTSEAHLGVVLNGMMRPWRWTLTAEYDRATSDIRTDAGLDVQAFQEAIDDGDPSLNPFAPFQSRDLVGRLQNYSRWRNEHARAELVTNGPIADLPAGELALTVKLGGDRRTLAGSARTNGVERQRDLGRDRAAVQASLDIPLASRRMGSPLGQLALNLNAEAEQLSDVGTLAGFGYGFTWSPVRSLRIVGSFARDDRAPTIQQLSDPMLVTPDSRVYDFVHNETVDVVRTTGGNPELRPQSRRKWKLGVTAQPLPAKELTLSAEYVRERVVNPIRSFPSVTPELEAAFPTRFQRSPDGLLVAVDARPLNFASRSADALRWGVRLSRPMGPERRSPQDPADTAQRAGGPAAEGNKGAARKGPRRASNAGRLQASVHHKWRMNDEMLVAAGGPTLDFLNGAAAGDTGGRARHEVEAKLALSRGGLTAKASGRWQAGSTVSGGAAQRDLVFSDLATLDFSVSANLGRQPGLARYGWLRDTRLTIGVRNVFDERLLVHDAQGATPIRYLPDVLDPFGRSVRISLRKLLR
ncbi:TonB-dependent receptor [Sphingomonas sp. LY54]|uniref:TonB-dependent receptor n=1 Tax=Sphingomonas sp. LY54 TaxID=3095343 RepID=UPI002D7800A5|nr:TonB-dependent receptor [Sphingomonas sp. LY54]WRP29966.1 TonB-dependent receptor [Sphingomonas sp. LY54]